MSSTTPIISVIVPVYNSSKYLKECLDSILNQTLIDIEVICVDDGSTDESPLILEEYASRDSRLQILKQENKGAGAARNLGMTIAKGKYLSFLDSDDFFSPDMLKHAYLNAEIYSSDITIFGYNKFFEDISSNSKREYGISWWSIPKSEVFSKNDVPDTIFDISTPCPWNKLFRHSFILDNDLKFQEISKCNDLYFVFSAFYSAKIISILDECLLSYRVGSKSSLQSNTYRSPCDIYSALEAVCDRCSKSSSWNLFRKGFANVALWQCVYQLDRLENNYPQQCSELLSLLLDRGFDKLGISDCKKEDFKDKLIYWKYESYTSDEKQDKSSHNKTANKLLNVWYSSRFYLRHIGRLALRTGVLNTIKYICNIIYDSIILRVCII